MNLEQIKQLINTGQDSKALTELSQFLRLEPENEEAWLLAASLVAEGDERKRLAKKGLAYVPGSSALRRFLEEGHEPEPAESLLAAPANIEWAGDEMDIQTNRIITLLQEQNQLLSSLVNEKQGHLQVKVKDIDMPFLALVGFIFKWIFASAIVSAVIGVVAFIFLLIFSLLGTGLLTIR